MKINELLESAFPKPVIITIAEFKSAQNAGKININSDASIYRGMSELEENKLYKLSPPTHRKSRNTTNWYTVIIDHIHLKWKKFPKRSESFICSTDIKKAESYSIDSSSSFTMYPLVGTKIAICPSSDIWYSFELLKKYGMYTVAAFNEILDELFDEFKGKYASAATVAEMIDFIGYLSSVSYNDIPQDSHVLRYTKGVYLRNIFEEFENLYDFIMYVFDPDENDFSIKTLTKDNSLPFGVEVWFSAPCYAVGSNVIGLDM